MTAPQAQGVVFPIDAKGERSTTRTGAEILAAALSPVHAQRALQERHWRRTYPAYFRQLVEDGLYSSEGAIARAQAGLDTAWRAMRWDRGTFITDLPTALANPPVAFETLRLKGQGDANPTPWTVPINGQELSGEALRNKIADWLARGIIEPSAGRALTRCLEHPEWFDLSDRTMVLLGAGSEAGPLRWLMRWRANVVAIDIDRPQVWERLSNLALAGNGTMLIPMRGAGGGEQTHDWLARAGANLISESPSIVQWLKTLAGPLDIASLAYLDGERHVRVSMGMDMITSSLCAHDHRTTLAYLATPTDVFAIAKETAEAAMAAHDARPIASRAMQRSLRLASGDKFFQPNVERLLPSNNGKQYGVVDCMVIEQGPNYALAKRLQQWRAVVARSQGIRVSLNVAPSTTTVSVVKNPALAAGFAGASSFGLEVFEPETTNALMAALWVHDLRCDESAASPTQTLAHPYELFMDNACHGGLWRSAYMARTALPFAAALGWVRKRMS